MSSSHLEPTTDRPLSVLYIHPIGAFGGASRSLLEILRAFPPGGVQARVLAPYGQAADLMERAGCAVMRVLGVSQFDCTRFGHYRGTRWLILLREVCYAPFTLWGIFKAHHTWRDIDIVHANEITALLPAVFAKRLFGKPLVVHIRSVQQMHGIPIRRSWLVRLLRRHADAVIAIDETVRASLPSDLDVAIVHNVFAPALPNEPHATTADAVRRFHPGSLKVGMVGNLLALKGVYDFLEAAKHCVRSHANIDFLIVGSNPRAITGLWGALLVRLGFAHDAEADVAQFITEQGLETRVQQIGFVSEIGAVYGSLDVLCFPSHLDAVGRPVLEAAWFAVPSVVAVDRTSPDTLIEGETGLRIPVRDPRALAEALMRLANDRAKVRRMGEAARQLAERNFESRTNALRLLEIYRKVLGDGGPAARMRRQDGAAG